MATPDLITPLTPLPEPPSRKVADQQRFDDLAYQSLKAQQKQVDELNADFIPKFNAALPAVDDALANRDIIHAAAGNAHAAGASAAAAAADADRAVTAATTAETEAGKILTLSVSAHPSSNDNIAADYSSNTGMLHLYIPKGPQGPPGNNGTNGKDGQDGAQGPPGQAPSLDVINCGGAALTQLVIINAGNAAT